MPEEIIIPQTLYTLLPISEYLALNNAISEAKGYAIGQATERVDRMEPQLAKINIVVEDETETYDLACIMAIEVDVQENYPELIEDLIFVERKDIVLADVTDTIPIVGDIDDDVVNWTMNHCEKEGVDTTELVTYIASKDADNYPPIPNEGEWCEAIVYSYNGDKVKCLQPHTRMHYTPEETPALWLIIPTITEGYPVWVQPTGAHDAYQIGDRVSFNGSDYESKINANVWSPTVYPAGWQEI